MIDLVRGAIVIVKDALDPQGQNPKNRPAVVLSKDCSKDAVAVVYITGEFDEPYRPSKSLYAGPKTATASLDSRKLA
jgi:mRNA-degrading endonuclease toxin of MazEF toxin-antitoxin module